MPFSTKFLSLLGGRGRLRGGLRTAFGCSFSSAKNIGPSRLLPTSVHSNSDDATHLLKRDIAPDATTNLLQSAKAVDLGYDANSLTKGWLPFFPTPPLPVGGRRNVGFRGSLQTTTSLQDVKRTGVRYISQHSSRKSKRNPKATAPAPSKRLSVQVVGANAVGSWMNFSDFNLKMSDDHFLLALESSKVFGGKFTNVVLADCELEVFKQEPTSGTDQGVPFKSENTVEDLFNQHYPLDGHNNGSQRLYVRVTVPQPKVAGKLFDIILP